MILIRPAASPVPALKYTLLPDRRDLIPGNAAIFYHRAIEHLIEVRVAPAARGGKGQDVAQTARRGGGNGSTVGSLSRWQRFPARPSASIWKVTRTVCTKSSWGPGASSATGSSSGATRDSTCSSWICRRCRALGRLLVLKTRLEIAEGRIDSAIHWLQTGLALGRHVGQHVEHTHSVADLRRDHDADGRSARGSDPGSRSTEPLLGSGQPAPAVPRPQHRAGRRKIAPGEGVSAAQEPGFGSLEHRAGPGVLGRLPEEDGHADGRLAPSPRARPPGPK